MREKYKIYIHIKCHPTIKILDVAITQVYTYDIQLKNYGTFDTSEKTD